MGKIVNVFGATGLVGKELVLQLVKDAGIEKIQLFGRRSVGIQDAKIKEYIVDFNQPQEWEDWVAGDTVFITMGTTRKQAGSKFAQYQVDFTFQYLAALSASKNGIPTAVLVSSAGASKQSKFFYPRIKGELELALEQLNFSRLVILRPSLLTGKRERPRWAEEWSEKILNPVTQRIFKKYRPIAGAIVAQAMIKACSEDYPEGVSIVELEEIFILAGQ